MNHRAAFLATLACAALGGWLPSLWLPAAPPEKPRLVPVLTSPPAPERSWQEKTRHARSPMAMLQAVVDGFTAHGSGFTLNSVAKESLGCAEAEELAVRLAADAMGREAADPAAFFKSLEKMKNADARFAALKAWEKAHPDAAVAVHSGPQSAGTDYRNFFIESLAVRDPDKAAALLRASPGGPSRHFVWRAVFAEYAKKGPDAALAAIRAAPAGERQGGTRVVLEKLAATDPHGALAWLESLPPELRAFSGPGDVFKAWAKTEPAAAFKEWMAQGKKSDDGTSFELTRAWASEDPGALFEWATAKGTDADQAVAAASKAMAWSDPQRALEMAAHAPPEMQKDLLREIGQTWAQNDPAAALAWARSLPSENRSEIIAGMIPNFETLSGDERRTVAREAGVATPAGFRLLFEVDPAEAEKVLPDLSPEAAWSVRREMSGALLEASPARAARFVEDLINSPRPPAAGGDDASSDLSGDIARLFPGHPGSSSESSGSAPIDGPAEDRGAAELSEIVAHVTASWAERDPVATAAWAGSLLPGAAADTAITNLVLTWGRYDLPAVRAWVDQLPAGDRHDKAEAQIRHFGNASGQ